MGRTNLSSYQHDIPRYVNLGFESLMVKSLTTVHTVQWSSCSIFGSTTVCSFLGCGSGVVCTISQASTAFCNRCNFAHTSFKCGSYDPRQTVLHKYSPVTEDLDEDRCLTESIKIYTGNEFTFTGKTDTKLSPFCSTRRIIYSL